MNTQAQTTAATAAATEGAQRRPWWIITAENTIAAAVSKHSRVALMYSGGIESALLMRLAEPWQQSITVYTVRTGAEFPHMVAFIDRHLAGWTHRVITSDLAASFAQNGLPASAVPIEHNPVTAAALNIEERKPRITPWPFCCLTNRTNPGWEAVKADGITAALHGQRAGDYPKPEPHVYPGVELIAPLWSVPRDEVWAAVRGLGIELPDHYGEYPSSLDCSVCPSSLTSKRRAWMAQRYPEALAVAEGLHAAVKTAVIEALDGDNTKNAHVPI